MIGRGHLWVPGGETQKRTPRWLGGLVLLLPLLCAGQTWVLGSRPCALARTGLLSPVPRTLRRDQVFPHRLYLQTLPKTASQIRHPLYHLEEPAHGPPAQRALQCRRVPPGRLASGWGSSPQAQACCSQCVRKLVSFRFCGALETDTVRRGFPHCPALLLPWGCRWGRPCSAYKPGCRLPPASRPLRPSHGLA